MSSRGELPSMGILQQKYDLHNAREVDIVVSAEQQRSGESIPNDPASTVGHYLVNLAERHSLFNAGVNEAELRKRAQVDHYVIKDRDIPQAYYELQKRIAREQGFGEIKLDQRTIRRLNFAVQADQRTSLRRWADYLSSSEAPYPTWFKYYTYRSVTQLANFDRQKASFRKRSKGTTSPFPELNQEALSYVYSKLQTRLEGEAIDDEVASELAAGANFGKLYAYAIEKTQSSLSPELLKQVEGEWVKFDRSNDPKIGKALAKSLEGQGTGWCVAGEITARSYLQHGDFYVYYTKDATGESTVPRLAIRMHEGTVTEVRGIVGGGAEDENTDQNVEPILTSVLAEKLVELPGNASYQKKFEDMRKLTQLEAILTKDPTADLTVDELRFLYEADGIIQGFGYKRDPRIEQLRNIRPSAQEDISKAYGYILGEGSELGPVRARQLITNGQFKELIVNLKSFQGLDSAIAYELADHFLLNQDEYKEWAEAAFSERVGMDFDSWPTIYALEILKDALPSLEPGMKFNSEMWLMLTTSLRWTDEYEQMFTYLHMFDNGTRVLANSIEHQAAIYNSDALLDTIQDPEILSAFKYLGIDTAKWLLKDFTREGWQDHLGKNIGSFDEEAQTYINDYLHSDKYIAERFNRLAANMDAAELLEAIEEGEFRLLDTNTAKRLINAYGYNTPELERILGLKNAFDEQAKAYVERGLTRYLSDIETKTERWSHLDEGYTPLND